MKQNGLRLTLGTKEEPEGELVIPVRAYHLYEVCTLYPKFDIVFLASKAYDTKWFVQFIEPYLNEDGVVVPVQNGMTEELVSAIVGRQRTLGCVLTGGGDLLKPGHVWRSRSMKHPYFTLGELDGKTTPRLQEVVKIMSDAGVVKTSDDILGMKWTKLVQNCMGAVASLCNKRLWEQLDDPRYIPAVGRIAREALEIGAKLGYKLQPITGLTPESLRSTPEELARTMIVNNSKGAPQGSVSMVQHDLEVGRPSEVSDFLNGYLLQKGRELNVPTPMNEAMIALHQRLVRKEIPWDASNMDLVPTA
jgi:2-dehydropantoate 2-reductase